MKFMFGLSTLSHANLEQPFRTLAIKWEVNMLLKKTSCVFLLASLSLSRCDAAWTCKWLYNISRFGACASRVLQGFKTWFKMLLKKSSCVFLPAFSFMRPLFLRLSACVCLYCCVVVMLHEHVNDYITFHSLTRVALGLNNIRKLIYLFNNNSHVFAHSFIVWIIPLILILFQQISLTNPFQLTITFGHRYTGSNGNTRTGAS